MRSAVIGHEDHAETERSRCRRRAPYRYAMLCARKGNTLQSLFALALDRPTGTGIVRVNNKSRTDGPSGVVSNERDALQCTRKLLSDRPCLTAVPRRKDNAVIATRP